MMIYPNIEVVMRDPMVSNAKLVIRCDDNFVLEGYISQDGKKIFEAHGRSIYQILTNLELLCTNWIEGGEE